MKESHIVSKWVEILLMPDQYDLQGAILEHFQDVRHPTPRDMEPGMHLSVPLRRDTAEFLDGLGVQYCKKDPKPRGRPSQDKTIRPYTFDKKIAEFVDGLPDGDRSRFVNSILGQGIAIEKVSGKFYNYFLIRSNGTVFYVGKGQGNRIDQHEEEAKRGIQSHKCNIIRQEWTNGEQIIKQKIAFHDNEADAYELEMLLISFFGRENLANGTDGGEGAAIGNRHAMIGEVGSMVVRMPSSLMNDLHKCLIIEEGEVTTDKARIAEYAMAILENYTRNKIEHIDFLPIPEGNGSPERTL